MHLESEVIYNMIYFDEEQTTEVTPDPATVTEESGSVEGAGAPLGGTEEVKTEEVPTEEGGDQNVSES